MATLLSRTAAATVLAVASASGLAAQAQAAAEGGDPLEIPESRWSVIDTTNSGAIRHAALADFVDVKGHRYIWLRVSRPREENNSFLFFGRMAFDCQRKHLALFRNFGSRDGVDLGGWAPPGWDRAPSPEQRRLLDRVCAIPARAVPLPAGTDTP